MRTKQLSDPVEESRIMILDPQTWPNWPILPLKMRVGQISDKGYCAFLIDALSAQTHTRAYLGLIFQAAEFQTLPTRDFASLDDLLAVYEVD